MSNKPRTTSKSGRSQPSTTPARSSQRKSSSANAPASFVQIFGEGESIEVLRLKDQHRKALDRLAAAMATPQPGIALYRSRRKAKINQLGRYVRQLEEALQAAKGK